jgi:4-amino-4-deoxy-L-arabinose transferase-like glycosyltransferase
LGSQSLWVDEAYSVKYANLDASLQWEHLFENLHGPLHAALLHGWTRVAGLSEAALRWPSVLASVLTLAALWILVRRWGGERLAWVATAALAVSPLSVWYAQEARNYSLFLLFVCLGLWSWLRAVEAPSSIRAWGLHVLALFLAFLSNLAAAFLLPVQALWLLGGRRRAWAGTVAAWAAVALLLLPWEIRFYRYRVVPATNVPPAAPAGVEPGRDGTWASLWGVPFTFYAFAGGTSLGPSLRELHGDRAEALRRHGPVLAASVLLFGALAIRGLLGPAVADRRRKLQLLAWLLVPPLTVWLVAVLKLKAVNPRYAMAAYPAFLVLLAAGWIGLRRKWMRWGALALVLAAWGLAWGRTHWHPDYQKENYRAAAAWLVERAGPGVLWITVGVDDPLRIYYLKDLFEGRALKEGTYRRLGSYPRSRWDLFWEENALLADRHDRVLLVESRAWDLDPEARGPALLESFCGRPEEKRWNGVRVLSCPSPAQRGGSDGEERSDGE